MTENHIVWSMSTPSDDFADVWINERSGRVSSDCTSIADSRKTVVGAADINQGVSALTPSLNSEEGIWVFDQGCWKRNRNLWLEVQKSSWDEVFLNDSLKSALQGDVEGFFASEDVYKNMSVIWKRGLLLYGPPGNGKTVSVRAIMKTCGDRGIVALSVKSFHGSRSPESAITAVFAKARELSPCVVVLEDLEGLIDERNRTFFLNELSGIASNHGLLFIGTTNDPNRLDPALSDRPGIFDRRYHFEHPGDVERLRYAQHWVKKLEAQRIYLPASAVEEIAWLTNSFSIADMKELFVSSVVSRNIAIGEKPCFLAMLKAQVEALRYQLSNKSTSSAVAYNPTTATYTPNLVSHTRRDNATRSSICNRRHFSADQSDSFASEKRQVLSGALNECICPSNHTSHGTHYESKMKPSGSVVVGLIDRVVNTSEASPMPSWADNAVFLFLFILATSLYFMYIHSYM